jgi:L-lysine 6-transaminase
MPPLVRGDRPPEARLMPISSPRRYPPVFPPERVRETLRRHLIADGFPIVFDFQRSHGSWVVDARDGREYLDFYSFFASLPLGFNHPAFDVPEHRERLLRAAIHKPSNSDADSPELAAFVDTFARRAARDAFPHLFFIEGGALAVENALKAAFDWKVRKNLAAGRGAIGSRILHFQQAFHGRTGYTLSLTNTLPLKVMYFPRFDWPRVTNPKLRFPVTPAEEQRVAAEEDRALQEIDCAFEAHPHEIAAIIIEPIQGEGGDNHFRGEFLRELRKAADRNDALLIFDEVQTGFGLTGRFWAYEHFGVCPDIVCFGKKSQVCGIMAASRLDEIPDNVFRVSSRINSTWGGGLADMVRCQIILDVMETEDLVGAAASAGEHLQMGLQNLQAELPHFVSNARGRGLFCAFDCPDRERRNALLARSRENGVLLLSCGEASIRLRPALTITSSDIDEAMNRLHDAARGFE